MTSRWLTRLRVFWLPALVALGCSPSAHNCPSSDGGTVTMDVPVSGPDDHAMTPTTEDASGVCGPLGAPCCPGSQCLSGYFCDDGVCGTVHTDGGTVMSGMDGGMMMPSLGPPDVSEMAPVDANPSVCRAPTEGAACSEITQMATPVAEMRVATAPPPTTAGWYPAGSYQLTAATVYTGSGGASGPSGISYAMTLQVNGVATVDYYQILRTQTGCPTGSVRFSGDTFNATSSLASVTWECPTCTNCGNTLDFTGTDTSLLLYFPQPDGTTLALSFETMAMSSGCGVAGAPCCGSTCSSGYTCSSAGLCTADTMSTPGTDGGADSDGSTGTCGTNHNPCCPDRTCQSGLICNAMTLCQG